MRLMKWEDEFLEQGGMHPPLSRAECDQHVKQYISPVMLTVNNDLGYSLFPFHLPSYNHN